MDTEARKQFEQKAFALVSFMVSSAHGLMRETKTYGPLRLLDGASRFIDIMKESGLDSSRLLAMQEKIEKVRLNAMESEEQYAADLQELVMALIPLMDEE